jgi:hypothetical protein
MLSDKRHEFRQPPMTRAAEAQTTSKQSLNKTIGGRTRYFKAIATQDRPVFEDRFVGREPIALSKARSWQAITHPFVTLLSMLSMPLYVSPTVRPGGGRTAGKKTLT